MIPYDNLEKNTLFTIKWEIIFINEIVNNLICFNSIRINYENIKMNFF